MFLGFCFLLSKLFPILLMPLFYKLTPLQDPELKRCLSTLASKVGLQITDILTFDLSKNSRKANAVLIGLGNTRKVILADTLVQSLTPDQVEAVLAHELGHQHYGHLWKFILFNAITTFTGLYIVNKLAISVLDKFGLERIDDISTVPLLVLILFLFGLAVTPVQNAFSRHLEKEADEHAVQTIDTGTPFISALEKLTHMNLNDPSPHPLIGFLFYDHPSVSKRIKWVKQGGSHLGKEE